MLIEPPRAQTGSRPSNIIKPRTRAELDELLAREGISTTGWGLNGIHSVEKLSRTLSLNNVYFTRNSTTTGACPLMLHVHCAVAQIWHMSTPLRELYEKRQTFPNGHVIERHKTFNGLGKTLDWNDGVAEHPLEGAHRLLSEELGQSQPLFKERERYQLFCKGVNLMGPMPHDKWPIFPTEFYRNVFLCELPPGSPLYLPDGYIEHEKPEDGGRIIEFAWKDIDAL